MYSYSRNGQGRTAGVYQIPVVKLVKQIDVIDQLTQSGGVIEKALDALNDIERLVKTDPDGSVSALQGLSRSAPEQRIEFLRKALQEAQKAVREVGSTYDGLNDVFVRLGLK